jgi:hypothetical protein
VTKPAPGTGALLGRQWEPRVIARHAYNAGWKDALDLVTILAIAAAESQLFDHAIHVNLDLSEDRGIYQLSSVHKWITDTIAYDVVAASDAAYTLYKARGGFEDWVAYTSGVYLHDSYLGRAVRGVGNFAAETMLAWPVPDHADGTPYVHSFTSPVLNFQHRLGGCLAHLQAGRKLLGWKAAGVTVVGSVQTELAHGESAAKAPLP